MSLDPVLHYATCDVPQGRILLLATHCGLARVVLGPDDVTLERLEALASCASPVVGNRGNSLLASLTGNLRRYFLGQRVEFSHVPVDLGAATVFQKHVWELTAQIPYGSVRSYGWLADRLEGRGCARAVGQALARNPVPVIVPCHRVIEESGAWGGFTAGEVWKGILLGLEGGEQRLRLRERRVRAAHPEHDHAPPSIVPTETGTEGRNFI